MAVKPAALMKLVGEGLLTSEVISFCGTNHMKKKAIFLPVCLPFSSDSVSPQPLYVTFLQLD